MTDYLFRAMDQDREEEERGEELAEELKRPPAPLPPPLSPSPEGEGGEDGRTAEAWDALAETLDGPGKTLALPAEGLSPGGGERFSPALEKTARAAVLPAGAGPVAPPLAALPAVSASAVSFGGRGAGQVPLPPVEGREEAGAETVLSRLRRAQRGAGFAQRERRAFTVTLPGEESAGPAWSAEELDRAVERDARRYGGEFGLY